MATVIEYNGKQYLFTFMSPETEWIRDLAKSMGITKESVVGAAMNKGLCYYAQTFFHAKVCDKLMDILEDELKPENSEVIEQQDIRKKSLDGDVDDT